MDAEVRLPCWRRSVVVPPTSCNLCGPDSICVDQTQFDGLFIHDLALTVTTLTQTHLGNILIPPALKNPLGILASQGYPKTHLIERSANIWSGLSLDPCHMLLKRISLNRGTSPATVIYEWLSFLVQLPIFSPYTFKHLPEAPT